jgi:hypothetical protein
MTRASKFSEADETRLWRRPEIRPDRRLSQTSMSNKA